MSLSFFIIRHITNENTDKYWRLCVSHIRKYYPNEQIYIIDDNSPYKTEESFNLDMENVSIIMSEFPKRGELLPYYYFLKNHPTDKAIMLHDSMFINSKLPIDESIDCKFLWHFDIKIWDDTNEILELLTELSYSTELIERYKSMKWNGCFGGCSIISWEFLNIMNDRYNFAKVLLDKIYTRGYRCNFERILAVMVEETSSNSSLTSVCGVIHNWCKETSRNVLNRSIDWDISYDLYISNKDKFDEETMIMKVWTGR